MPRDRSRERERERDSTSSRHKRSRTEYDSDEGRGRDKHKSGSSSKSKRETSAERKERKAAKKAAKKAEASTSLSQAYNSAYGAGDNPFNDVDLSSQFVWGKKREKEKKMGLTQEQARIRDQERRAEAKEELEKLNRRREEREVELELREAESTRLAALNDGAQMAEWIAKEDDFYLEQSKKRAEIRVREHRAKPIDFLALNLKWSVPKADMPADEEDEGEGLDVDLEEPYAIFENISLEETEELEEDIKMYLSLEKDQTNLDFWKSMLLVCASALETRRSERRLGQAYGEHVRAAEAMKQEFTALLRGKSQAQLGQLQSQVQRKLTSGEPIDVEYWENLLKELIVWKAKNKLKDMHEVVLQNRLEQLRRKQRDEALQTQSELVQALPQSKEIELDDGGDLAAGDLAEPEPEEEPDVWDPSMEPPALRTLTNEDKELELVELDEERVRLVAARRAVHATRFVSRKHKRRAGAYEADEQHKTKDQLAEALYQAEVENGLDDDEELFNMEAELSRQTYVWEDKYRPRKPRYFNKVMTGFEWNKYNQTHYDIDNPPPKVVTGYRMVLFYPDLIDKSKAPSFHLIKDKNNEDTCTLIFKAGPPYEDIAFQIVNREWEYSHKRGFRSTFDRGVLQLAFTFKRLHYRK